MEPLNNIPTYNETKIDGPITILVKPKDEILELNDENKRSLEIKVKTYVVFFLLLFIFYVGSVILFYILTIHIIDAYYRYTLSLAIAMTIIASIIFIAWSFMMTYCESFILMLDDLIQKRSGKIIPQ